ncbi:MAG TPA: right-handed parallel beta-helix repeat-containing protein, partial [Candidatus Hydrogenedentes bacterium]|nr:right-handed parallel beta-helix repeat-containing protein [Candidatus Hydrogenedentota bacterium]
MARRLYFHPFHGLLLALFLLEAAGLAEAQTTTYYVATNGNDAWSGLLSAPNVSLTDGPFATLVGARNGIRALKTAHSGQLPGPVVVEIRGGTYVLSDTVTFEAQDTGASDKTITYRAYSGEHPVFSGGKLLSGWQQEGSLWKVVLPEVQGGTWWFSVLFVGGELRMPARDPNLTGDSRDPDEDGFFNTAGTVEEAPECFYYTAGDLQSYENPEDVLVMVMHAWDESYHRIAGLDTVNHIVTFEDIDPGTPESDHNEFELWGSGQRYCVWHAWEALDTPGEWWLDRGTGTLYYYPEAGETMGGTAIYAPKLETLVRFSGNEVTPISYLRFEGLEFSHSNYVFGPNVPRSTTYGLTQYSVSHFLPAAIQAAGLSYSRFEECIFSHLSAYSVLLRNACVSNELRGNEAVDLGGGGLEVNRDYLNTTLNTVDNNWVHDGGKLFPSAVGIRIGMSSYNNITHNEVSDLGYCGISAGWLVGYGESTCHDNMIEDNHVHHIGQGILSDMGGIYLAGPAPNTVVNNNLVHDVRMYARGYGGWGIYLDEGASNITVQNNVVHSTDSGGIHINYGRTNTIQNNIFAWGVLDQIQRTQTEPEAYYTINFNKNIVLLNNSHLFAGAWTDYKFLFDYNCYWDISGYEFMFPPGTFAQWQSTGQDPHSIVSDPLFTDAEHYDFTLSGSSPAITQLGFAPVDISGVGLYGDPAWVNGPDSISREETPLPPAPEDVQYPYDFELDEAGSAPEGWGVLNDEDSLVAGVFVSETQAIGGQSMNIVDAAGLDYSWMPVAYMEPDFRYGLAVMRLWLRVSSAAQFLIEWRDGGSAGYLVGPTLAVLEWGLFSNSVLLEQLPRNEWFQLEVVCPLGHDADNTFDLRLWTASQGWHEYLNQPCADSGFDRLSWLGIVSFAETSDQLYVDNFELYVVTAGADTDGDGILDWKEGVADPDGDGLPNYRDPDSDGDGLLDSQEYRSHEDADNDGFPNFLDTDSDGDGLPDGTEGTGDPDSDSKPNFVDTDSDGDGLPDATEGTGDPDGDSQPNFLDTDSNNNGILDGTEGTGDIDSDSIPNFRDPDNDNDGIPDAIEGTGNPDGDGLPNYLDPDSDGDGIPDSVEGTVQSDADGIPNFLDTDSDGDGIPDATEGTGNPDGDGLPNYVDPDSDGDGIPDATEGTGNPDGDSTANYLDLDSDGDGIPDATEGTGNPDGDSTANYLDLDSDGDGIPDATEGTGNPDGDSSPNYLDLDSDGDGIPDATEGAGNPDGDSSPNYLDLDSDGDGIPDATEGTGNPDGDSTANYLDLDSDGDGIPDATEGTGNPDGDSSPNYLDLDSDGDGIPDATEGTGNPDGDSTANYLDLDSDGDGIPDATEGTGNPDGDSSPNYLDTDSDGDGILDATEGTGNPDLDSLPNYLDTDSDGDGLPDSVEGAGDRDTDSTPNFLDLDSDGDGIPDSIEGAGNPDGDGYANFLDLDADGDGIPDATEGSGDQDGDGTRNFLDLDSDDDDINDSVEGAGNPDGDELPNFLDDDSDGDGISDHVEGVIDTDLDSTPNYLDTDSDGDGIDDIEEGTGDPDGDSIPNYLDSSSDLDGIPDDVEGGGDLDGDGVPNFLDPDSDGDGIDDIVEGTGDSDGDGIPNFLDVDADADGDGIGDAAEGTDDLDGDGTPNYLDLDSDDDDIPDAVEGTGDPDGDSIPNYKDDDSDGDGISDKVEGVVNSDGDSLPNYLDPDSDGDGISDLIEGAGHGDGDGIPNYLDPDSDNDGLSDAIEGSGNPDGDELPNFLDSDSDGDGINDSVEGTGNPDSDALPN